jgi:phosphoribosylformimino-5-aminoimidazole carboxamide ribotide isomerase
MKPRLDIEETRRRAAAVPTPVIASGGVGTLAHVRALLSLEAVGVTGVITGKALYSGSLRFEDAMALSAEIAHGPAPSVSPRSASCIDKH